MGKGKLFDLAMDRQNTDGEPRGVPREVYMGDGSWVSFL